MNWGSLGAFFEMGGYGFYVWGSYGVALVMVVLELLLLAARRRALVENAGQRAGGRP